MQAIFFDLDGTLSDPKTGITRSIQYALEKLDIDVPAADDLSWCIGPPLLQSLESLLGDRHLAEQALVLYRQRFSESGLYENALYPGIVDVLSDLTAAGYRLFVATSKPTVYAKRIADHFAITPFFEQVFGSELSGVNSDKSHLLAAALAATGLSGRASVMIGDRSYDMIGACRNAMTPVGVLYGYGSEAELRTAGAIQIAATTDDLFAAITSAGNPSPPKGAGV